jgi:putative peptidoglycan lipid II flippase
MPDPEHSVVRSAGIVSAAVALSRVSGLVREMVMARLFGAGQAYDAFLLGFRIPNLTRDLFAEGALSSAFVPTFTQCLATKGKKQAAELASLVATAILIVVGLLSLAGVVFSPALVRLLAPGFAAVPGKFELAVQMTRIMFPFLLLVALAAQAMGILNACNRFGVPALSSTFFNLGSVAFGLLLGFWAGPRLGWSPIQGMAVGIVLGGGLQLVSQFPSLRRAGFGFRFRVNLRDPDLVRIGRMMVPAILGNAAVQINVMVNTNFASGIWDPVRGLDGPVSWLAYAFRFMQLPLGLFGVAIASATLPAISRSAAAKDMEEFRSTLARSLGLVFLLTVPSSAGLALLGNSMIGAIYQGGRFQAYDTQQTALALSCYAIGLAGYAAIKVLAPAFYALGDSRTPMYISLASIATNYVVASLMIRAAGMGHAGLALSTSAVAITGFVALFWILRNRLGGIHGRALACDAARILAATAVMGGVVWLSSRAMQPFGYLADVAVSVPLGAVVFFLAGRWFGIKELKLVRVRGSRV